MTITWFASLGLIATAVSNWLPAAFVRLTLEPTIGTAEEADWIRIAASRRSAAGFTGLSFIGLNRGRFEFLIGVNRLVLPMIEAPLPDFVNRGIDEQLQEKRSKDTADQGC